MWTGLRGGGHRERSLPFGARPGSRGPCAVYTPLSPPAGQSTILNAHPHLVCVVALMLTHCRELQHIRSCRRPSCHLLLSARYRCCEWIACSLSYNSLLVSISFSFPRKTPSPPALSPGLDSPQSQSKQSAVVVRSYPISQTHEQIYARAPNSSYWRHYGPPLEHAPCDFSIAMATSANSSLERKPSGNSGRARVGILSQTFHTLLQAASGHTSSVDLAQTIKFGSRDRRAAATQRRTVSQKSSAGTMDFPCK